MCADSAHCDSRRRISGRLLRTHRRLLHFGRFRAGRATRDQGNWRKMEGGEREKRKEEGKLKGREREEREREEGEKEEKRDPLGSGQCTTGIAPEASRASWRRVDGRVETGGDGQRRAETSWDGGDGGDGGDGWRRGSNGRVTAE